MTKTRKIHVDQKNIRKNHKEGTNLPVLTVLTYDTNDKGNEVEIQGPSKIVYGGENPLSCGARVWIETKSPVVIDGKKVV